MNSIHNNGENDKSLNEGLDKLSRVYGQLEQDEPPELLDQAILNSAHRAVEKKPHWMKFGWLHGLTTAAVFVLAFSIILDQRETAPVFEDAMRSSETIGLKREKATKKQSVSELKLEHSQLPDKEKVERRLDMQQNMPAAAAPAREQILEEAVMDEVDLMTAAPQAGAISKQARPAVATEPLAGEVKSRARTETEAEQRLLAIIKLKQDGDDSWETELESFREEFPDYPLPIELTD